MSRPHASEFLPLPFFPFEELPHNTPIDLEDAATALVLSDGNVPAAAQRLRVTPARLQRAINKSPRLIRLMTRLNAACHESDAECTTATNSQSAQKPTGGARP